MKKKYNEVYSLSKYLNAINYTKEPLMENKEDPFWEKKYPLPHGPPPAIDQSSPVNDVESADQKQHRPVEHAV